jgi:hypothetical protein
MMVRFLSTPYFSNHTMPKHKGTLTWGQFDESVLVVIYGQNFIFVK